MKTAGRLLVLTLAVGTTPVTAGTLKCPPDSVKVGDSCIDLYEESVWQIDPVLNAELVKKVQAGTSTLTDLTNGGATPLGCFDGQSAYPANFPSDGNWTPVPGSSPPSPGVYAVSIPGVLPSTCISWFRAVQACALSGSTSPATRSGSARRRARPTRARTTARPTAMF